MSIRGVLFGVVGASAVLLVACESDSPTQPQPPEGCENESCLIDHVAAAYAGLDPTAFAALHHQDFTYSRDVDSCHVHVTSNNWMEAHARLFLPPSDEPGAPESWLSRVEVTFVPYGAFAEWTDAYRSDANPSGLDPARWRATRAHYYLDARFETRTYGAYKVSDRAMLAVVEDLTKPAGDPQEFLLYRWEDVGRGFWWDQVQYPGPRFVWLGDFIEALASTYSRRDFSGLTPLLANEDGHRYQFLSPRRFGPGIDSWDVDEELRLHRRMLDPEHIPIGDPPVQDEMWVSWIQARFVPLTPWSAVPDSVITPLSSQTSGYRPRWRGYEATYETPTVLETRWELQFFIETRSRFVVLEDQDATACWTRRFLLYRWEELEQVNRPASAPPVANSVEPGTWGEIKSIYR